MWTPVILAMVVVLVIGEEVVVDEKVMRDQLDTLVDQEEGARGPRVERGVLDHDEGSGGGLLGSSFPDYGIDDEDQVWESLWEGPKMGARKLNWEENVENWANKIKSG